MWVWQRCKIQQSNSRFPNEKIHFPSAWFFCLTVIYKSMCLLKTNDRFLLTVMKSTEKLDGWEGLIHGTHAYQTKTEWLCAASYQLSLYTIVNWAYTKTLSHLCTCACIDECWWTTVNKKWCVCSCIVYSAEQRTEILYRRREVTQKEIEILAVGLSGEWYSI